MDRVREGGRYQMTPNPPIRSSRERRAKCRHTFRALIRRLGDCRFCDHMFNCARNAASPRAERASLVQLMHISLC